MIPYFDAHCDTVYRCEMTGEGLSIDLGSNAQAQRDYFARARGLGENSGHIDLRRAKACFGRYAQIFALFYDPADKPAEGMWGMCRRLYARFLRETEENAAFIARCRTGAEIDSAVAAGKAAALLSIEGADLLECDIDRIPEAARWGVKLLNPVWNRANVLSGTNAEDKERGLSEKGRDFIRALESSAIYADVSHLSDAGFWDLIKLARRPVVASHSNSRALCPHPRNLTDDMFRAIRDTGGVVGLNLYLDFVGAGSMDALVAHVEHFLNLGGEKTLCMGGDLDGCEALAGGMAGIEDVPALYEALCSRGYPAALLEDIFWNNLRRLF